jgi:RNA polymerase sigma factor (sigma-70 family)
MNENRNNHLDPLSAEKVIDQVKDQIFNLSVRMLSNFEDAEDATQDILCKVIRHYHTLKDKDKLEAWASRIAKNHLINKKKEDSRFKYLSFEVMEQDCGMPMDERANDALSMEEQDRLLAELKISCSQAMLMCLSKEERFVYVLSSMFEVNSVVGAEVLEMTPEAFRQKLSRAKSKLKNFLERNCGLVNPSATCQCRKRLQYALDSHRISKDVSVFCSGRYLVEPLRVNAFTQAMERFEDWSDVFKTNPDYRLPDERKQCILKAAFEKIS